MKNKLAISMFGQKRLSREGGIEIVVKELCTRMVRDGCAVTCYNRSGHHVSGAEYDQKTEYEGIRQAKLITEKFGLTKDSYILFLGRLVPEKGIRYLVEVFKKIDTNKKLVIAGGSSDTDSFMQELKTMSKDDNRIIFTGFVQGEIPYCIRSGLSTLSDIIERFVRFVMFYLPTGNEIIMYQNICFQIL